MKINLGYEISISCPQPTEVITLLEINKDRQGDIISQDAVQLAPDVDSHVYLDVFGNLCRRLTAPAGGVTLSYNALVNDDGKPDEIDETARETPIHDLPDDVILYLLGSRYCETDELMELAWRLFGPVAPSWPRVKAIFNYVHDRLTFGYGHARATRTAAQAHEEQVGVCRDFAHLAIAFCRCMNIPARYVNGYLGDIGVPADPAPMDFSAWTEVYLDGKWYTLDARHNRPRIGRVVIARGRDATDVPLLHTFGPHQLTTFRVWTDELDAGPS